MQTEPRPRELTGRAVLTIAVSAFAVIFGANMTLAFYATGTFPGLEVKNPYIASQSFDARRAAQKALGWTTQIVHEPRGLRISVLDKVGLHAPLSDVTIRVGRPTHSGEDQFFTYDLLTRDATLGVSLAPGHWRIDVTGQSPDGTAYATRQVLEVAG